MYRLGLPLKLLVTDMRADRSLRDSSTCQRILMARSFLSASSAAIKIGQYYAAGISLISLTMCALPATCCYDFCRFTLPLSNVLSPYRGRNSLPC